MDIKQAKEALRRTYLVYTERDEFGSLRIPAEQQRPLLLMGPPGVGKTAILSQLAEELGAGLVAYTMTHHTRQSALGLPVLREKTFGGKTYTATEYTMSEILASVYERIEKTGVPTGILFLDEINCVSETLMPAMLQLLQSKQFGTHRLPEGWVIAAAGNPPAYNESARTFDTVTMDRVRLLQIEADYLVWCAREGAASGSAVVFGAEPGALFLRGAARARQKLCDRARLGGFVTAAHKLRAIGL